MEYRTRQQQHYELRAATPEDVPWLNDLRREAYRELFNLTWGAWDEQRLGVASAVLNDLIRSARSCRVPVRLSTGLKNERARSLYERLGFRVTATTETHFHLKLD